MTEPKREYNRHFEPVLSPIKMLVSGEGFNKAPIHKNKRHSEVKLSLLSPREVLNQARYETLPDEVYNPKMLKSQYMPPTDITINNVVDNQINRHKFGIKNYNPRN